MSNCKIKYFLFFCILILDRVSFGQTNTIWGPDGFIKIEEGSGGFEANLDPGDRFSRDHDVIGDVNGDGVLDLVVGARSDDDGAIDAGAVYILLMNTDGTVMANQKISMLEGGFSDSLLPGNFFGYGVAGIGDYDADGIPDIAVSAPVPPNHAIYIIFLNANGTVKNMVKNQHIVAQGLSCIGDLNNDGRKDLAACDPGSDIGGSDIGGVRLLFLNGNGQLMPAQTVYIGDQSSGFGAGLLPNDQFGGREVAHLGDLDADGNPELAIGAFMSDGGKGAIWIVSLDAITHQVLSKQKIAEGVGGFNDTLTAGANPNGTAGANFGHALCATGDLNGDGIPDLMTGANQQNEGWAYILYLNSDKTVQSYTQINNLSGGFSLSLDPEERFSRSISFVGDLRQDGTIGVNIGGGAGGTGTLYLLFFKPCLFESIANGFNWSYPTNLFDNWDNQSNQLIGNPLSWPQCAFRAFEHNAAKLNYWPAIGRCQCFDSNAQQMAGIDINSYSNGCYESQSNLDEQVKDISFLIYPHPSNGIISIEFSDFVQGEKVEFELRNNLGQLLLCNEFQSTTESLDLSGFPAGTYQIVIKRKQYNKVSTFYLL